MNGWQALGKYYDHTQRDTKEGERERGGGGGREGERGRDGKRMKYIYYKYMVCMKLLVNTVLSLPHALYRERFQDMMLVLTMNTETTEKREREKIIKNPTLYVELFDVIKLHVFLSSCTVVIYMYMRCVYDMWSCESHVT